MNTSNYTPVVASKCVTYKTLFIGGLNIAYREAGDPVNPKLVLLHGFPSSSHQYRNLIPSLADRFHVISPDYPGFGNSDLPDPAKFAYTFDNLAEVTGRFLEQKGFHRFGMYVQDYGGPVGFRIVTQKPEAHRLEAIGCVQHTGEEFVMLISHRLKPIAPQRVKGRELRPVMIRCSDGHVVRQVHYPAPDIVRNEVRRARRRAVRERKSFVWQQSPRCPKICRTNRFGHVHLKVAYSAASSCLSRREAKVPHYRPS